MQIRHAAETDVASIVQLSRALFQEDAGQRDETVNLNWAVEHGQAYFSQFIESDQKICLCAIVDQAVVGYLAGYVRDASDYRLVKTAEIESMFIRKSHRGQGLGTALARHFKDWAEENGAEMMMVTAYAANQSAVNFYKALGFAPKQVTLAINF